MRPEDARLDLDGADVAVAQVLDVQLVAFLDTPHELEQAAVCFGAIIGAHGFAIDRGDDVARPQSGLVRGAARRYAEDIHAFYGALLLVAADRDAEPRLTHQFDDRLFDFLQARQILLAQLGDPARRLLELAFRLAHLPLDLLLLQLRLRPALFRLAARVFGLGALRSDLPGEHQRHRGRYQCLHDLHRNSTPETFKMRFAAPAHSACQPAISSA